MYPVTVWGCPEQTFGKPASAVFRSLEDHTMTTLFEEYRLIHMDEAQPFQILGIYEPALDILYDPLLIVPEGIRGDITIITRRLASVKFPWSHAGKGSIEYRYRSEGEIARIPMTRERSEEQAYRPDARIDFERMDDRSLGELLARRGWLSLNDRIQIKNGRKNVLREPVRDILEEQLYLLQHARCEFDIIQENYKRGYPAGSDKTLIAGFYRQQDSEYNDAIENIHQGKAGVSLDIFKP